MFDCLVYYFYDVGRKLLRWFAVHGCLDILLIILQGLGNLLLRFCVSGFSRLIYVLGKLGNRDGKKYLR
jgi:hypothetical protein